MRALLATTMLAAVAFATPAAAQTTIDFSTFANGTAVPSAQGVTFSMSGGPNTATTPVAADVFDLGGQVALTNSDTDNYPTNSRLTALFNTTASAISFTFNNFGDDNGSFYSAFDIAGALVSTGRLDSGTTVSSYGTVSVTGMGIKTLTWDNNQAGGNNWQFGVGALSFTAGAVPEPATWAMMIVGFGAVGGAMRRRTATRATVSFA